MADNAEGQLRDYQAAAVAGVMAAHEGGEPGALVVHATGTGKTWVAAAVASRFAGRKQRTLILADLGELLGQAAKALDHFGLRYAVEKSEEKARVGSMFDDVVLGSVQSLRSQRLLRWPKDYFSLVIFDEAHVSLAATYRKTIEHFNAFRLGMTATPERGDGRKLGVLYPVLAHEYSLRTAIREGNLCPLLIDRPATSVDLSKIRTTGGDLNRGDLEDEISKHIEELVCSTKSRIGSRPAIVFTPDVGSAQAFADGLRQVGLSARYVAGDSADRDTTIAEFKAGGYQILCNCRLLTKGIDVPRVAAIVLANPTKSGTLYRQMVGRGTRNYPGKANCLILDFAWNSGEHDLISPVELFDESGMGEQVQRIADELITEGTEPDPLKAVVAAEKFAKFLLARRVSVRERESRMRFLTFDPFEIASLLGVPARKATGTPAAPGQGVIRRLESHRVQPGVMGARQAATLANVLDDRKRKGLATYRQVVSLVGNGVEQDLALTLAFREASERLDILIGNRRPVHA